MNKNEIKKDLYRSKAMAKFSHYENGKLFYRVELESGLYQFPISTVEELVEEAIMGEMEMIKVFRLSDDIGTTPFMSEMRGSDLNRWINKAIDNDEFIELMQK